MPPADPTTDDAPWIGRASAALERYAEPLLRAVAGRLIRPRSQWPPEELRGRIAAALEDAVILDRTLRTLSPACRRLLKLIGLSRQPLWRVQPLVELLAALGHAEGVGPIQELLEAGLLFPDLPARTPPVTDFPTWLGQAATQPLAAFTVPRVAGRVRGEDLGLGLLPHEMSSDAAAQEADGLEWPLRLAVLWQQVRAAPLRLTQQRGFFKRDYDRLRSHPLLTAPAADQIAPVADPGLFAVELALAEGVLIRTEEEVEAGRFPQHWSEGVGAAIAGLWAALLRVEGYDAVAGWIGPSGEGGRPFAAPALLTLALLAQLPENAWIGPDGIEEWLAGHYPDWAKRAAAAEGPDWSAAFLLGLAFQLRLIQALKHGPDWRVRLSPIGRAILGGGPLPAARPPVEQTLLVQPNLEIVLFRQGLTPELVARLSRFAIWKTLGPACTLTLTAESVYQGLESGETLADLTRLLERHGTRAISETVLESLRSWASKRERVLVYSSAILLEFRTEADLSQALKLGLVEMKLTDRIGLVSDEGQIDYGHFRLVGSRDYLAPEECCVEVAADGLGFAVNEYRSDLLLESEIRRFAEPDPTPGDERPHFRMTRATLQATRARGLDGRQLNDWFVRRAGEPLSATARLLLAGEETPPLTLQPMHVLRLPSSDLADGLAKWPETARLVGERLGPALLAVPEEAIEPLRAKLAELGVKLLTE